MNPLRTAYEAAKSDRKAAERAGLCWASLRQFYAAEREAYLAMTDDFISDLNGMVADLRFIAAQIGTDHRVTT